jgi:hypothetical protein
MSRRGPAVLRALLLAARIAIVATSILVCLFNKVCGRLVEVEG